MLLALNIRQRNLFGGFVKNFPDNQNIKVYVDNYFTFLELQLLGSQRGIYSIGTICANRSWKSDFKIYGQLKRKGHGSIDTCYDTLKKILVTRWFVRRAVTIFLHILELIRLEQKTDGIALQRK